MICFGAVPRSQNNNYIYTFPVAYIEFYFVCVTCNGIESLAFSMHKTLTGFTPAVYYGDKPRDWISIGY